MVGEVDMSTAPMLADAIGTALADETAQSAQPVVSVSIDLSSVGFIDSSGLRALLAGRSHAESQGVRLSVVSASPSVTRLLEATGLSELLAGG